MLSLVSCCRCRFLPINNFRAGVTPVLVSLDPARAVRRRTGRTYRTNGAVVAKFVGLVRCMSWYRTKRRKENTVVFGILESTVNENPYW